MKITQYVIVNKALGMSPGKVAAQVAHATIGAYRQSKPEMQEAWVKEPHQWALVLEAEDGEQLDNLVYFLESRGFTTHPVIDEGANEVRPFSMTAVGVELVDKDDALVKSILGLLPSYHYEAPPVMLPLSHYYNVVAAHDHLNRKGEQFRFSVKAKEETWTP